MKRCTAHDKQKGRHLQRRPVRRPKAQYSHNGMRCRSGSRAATRPYARTCESSTMRSARKLKVTTASPFCTDPTAAGAASRGSVCLAIAVKHCGGGTLAIQPPSWHCLVGSSAAEQLAARQLLKCPNNSGIQARGAPPGLSAAPTITQGSTYWSASGEQVRCPLRRCASTGVPHHGGMQPSLALLSLPSTTAPVVECAPT